jgi:hypothetical protein
MLTRRKLATPYPLGLDAGHPWWMTGGMDLRFPHSQPTVGDGGGGATGGGTDNPDGEPGGTGAGGAGDTGGSGNGATDDPDPRWREHLSAADKKREAAERERDAMAAKLKEIEDKDKSELERTTERVKVLEQQVQQDKEEIGKLRLENAFLTVNEVSWHDNEDALRAARDGGYLEQVVKDDGTIDRDKLNRQLKSLADKKKYLVKTEQEPPQPPSGAGVGSGGRGGNQGNPDEAKLRERYSRLRR